MVLNSILQNIKDDVIFGFHRLAINGLDVESNQPIVSRGNYLICNGEIYNHSELFEQQKLEKNTNSDCEAILKGYERNGINIINMLDGVFGCLIYDNDKKENDQKSHSQNVVYRNSEHRYMNGMDNPKEDENASQVRFITEQLAFGLIEYIFFDCCSVFGLAL